MTDWTIWLGPAADDLTEGRRGRFDAAGAAIELRYPHPDEQDERDAALSALVQYLLGETTIDEVGRRRTATQRAEREASVAAQQVALLAVEDGMSESEAARRAGLDRMTVRRLLGKR